MSPKDKPWLHRWYIDVYHRMAMELPGLFLRRILEVGSGGHNTIREVIPNCVTSDICQGNDMVMWADRIQAGDSTLDAILALNVIHHLSHPDGFFREAVRCLKVGGRIVCIEPSNTHWARFVYRWHHEKQRQETLWQILVDRRQAFEDTYPMLKIVKIETFCPISYILSGGVKRRWSAPMCLYLPVQWLDRVFKKQGIFATYVLEKTC